MYISRNEDRICQGDILADVTYRYASFNSGGDLEVDEKSFPYVVVFSQDCDLKWDYETRLNPEKDSDKYLDSILVCPAFIAEKVKEGIHLDQIGYKMQKISSGDMWKQIIRNNNPRYHYLEGVEEGTNLIIDYKRYYTLPRQSTYTEYKDSFITRIADLYREDAALRFANYLARIALPD